MNRACSLLSFDDALAQTRGQKRSILLGNGFSISQTAGGFSYGSLLSFAKKNLKPGSHFYKIFDLLKTNDFENVISALENVAAINLLYNEKKLASKIAKNALQIRDILVCSIIDVHLKIPNFLPLGESAVCVLSYLKNFDEIYTVNYDLLLYWLSIHFSNIIMDGFGLTNNCILSNFFNTNAHHNIHYIHGGLHLFHQKDGTRKLILGKEHFLEEIICYLRNNNNVPLYVAEGTSEQKLHKIKSVPYLLHCYNKLHNASGSMFIFGHSLSVTDEHIYHAIFSSKITSLYICFYKPEELQLFRERIAVFKERNSAIEIFYIDAQKANIWGKGVFGKSGKKNVENFLANISTQASKNISLTATFCCKKVSGKLCTKVNIKTPEFINIQPDLTDVTSITVTLANENSILAQQCYKVADLVAGQRIRIIFYIMNFISCNLKDYKLYSELFKPAVQALEEEVMEKFVAEYNAVVAMKVF